MTGRKERIVPFGVATKKHLLRYLSAWRPESDSDLLVLTLDGSRMIYDNLAHSVKRMGNNVGIPRLRAHLFRHTFAVKYLINGGDVMSLRQMLGHTTLDVTKMYMHLAQSHIQIQHHRFSPVDRLQIRRRKR